VSILQDLGTDLVTVANNHALDFGQDAFCDTLDTLKQAGITCVGGGYHIAEASAPAVCTVNGQTFAIFAATRVSPSYDWYATDSQPGMFQTYDPTKLNAAIAEAEETYDHTIVFVHWGIEHVEYPEDYQRALAKGYIDAGADLIIGCHPHILQGFEYYRDVPVIYSLGNYLFGNRDGNTLLLKAVFHADGALDIRFVPCKRQNGILSVIEEPGSLYQHLTELSFHAEVSAEGVLRSSVTE
ncbi:MAG: CapA family protein, partial [Lachnospiraceae bacterium]|nr:CapA family protein [Lachnospiraceae bacterium]